MTALEAKIQREIIRELHKNDWYAKSTHGNAFQSGIPDVYCCHRVYGPRWVEVKRPKLGHLEDSQYEVFSEWEQRNVGVWLLKEPDLSPLFKPPNWRIMVRGDKPRAKRVVRVGSSGPERDLQELLKAQLTTTGWYCTDFFGHTFSYGFPDFYCCHADWGSRWVEVKIKPSFTPAQKKNFVVMADFGAKIWVLRTGDISPLFRPPNLGDYDLSIPDPLEGLT
jgi:hypothetical protein